MTKSTTELVLECFANDSVKWPWVIAGGALRDSWFDKEVKDVDLFVWKTELYYDDHVKNDHFYMLLGAAPGYNWDGVGYKFVKDGPEYEGHQPEFVSFRSDEVPGLNIIFLPWPEKLGYGNKVDDHDKVVPDLLASFPASISKIAYNSQWDKWWIDPDFAQSIAEKTIFCENSRNGVQYYYGKLAVKYNRWAVSFE